MIRGADFSNHQTQAQMVAFLHQNPDVKFVLLKASQGVHYVDPTFAEKADYLLSHRVLVAAYHFLDFTGSGAAQFDHFLDTIAPWLAFAPTSFVPFACDYEAPLIEDPARGDRVCGDFIARGHDLAFRVGKYGSSGVSRKNHGEDWRWAAWWGANPPPYRWDIWQWTSKPYDLDVYNGSLGQLGSFWVRMSRPRGRLGL